MNRIKTALISLLLILMSLAALPGTVFAQDNQASLLLDLRKARATYESAVQKLESDRRLFENKAISEEEYNRSQNDLLGAEVDYQKLILRVIAEQSYVIVEKAVKYQTPAGERRVRVILRSTMEGNQEYLSQFEQYFDVFTPEMRSNKIYNVFVSLVRPDDSIIIGTPYEIRIPVLELGSTAEADFGLLRDVESVQVSLNYGGRKDTKNIYLEKDASANVVDIASSQFSMEADLGANAVFELTLERFSDSDDVYTMTVLNLPRQVGYEFIDAETNARISQVKFTQGVNTRRLSLRTFLPDRDDEDIVIDKPLVFYVLAPTTDEREKLGDTYERQYTPEELENVQAGRVRLELVPRGVGRIEVRAPSLYHEITAGDSVGMDITVRNDGTRRLDNIRISTDNPLNWRSVVEPDLIRSLEPTRETTVRLTFLPPENVTVGRQEFKIRTEAMADNRRVQTDDKTVSIQVQARTPILWTSILILALIGFVVGIVVFGIRISRR